MSTKTEGVGEQVQPDWLTLPDKATYWTCQGTYPEPKRCWLRKKPTDRSIFWKVAYYSKEDAEANAVIPFASGWVWGGGPAHEISISEMMMDARQNNYRGVFIRAFRGGQWITVKTYPANEPLPEELREQ